MSENGGTLIRVTLRWIQIKDNKEAMWDDEGEFRFRSKVTSGSKVEEIEFPEQGYWAISDHPRRNKVDKIDKVLFEGEAAETLVVELFGVELDQMSANDHLADYRREYTGAVATWAGRHQPTDEGSADPENMVDWRVCYDIEVV
ncbi:MAG: hypothetical protein OEO79_11680 [Gemmatimonadota bacterium]|nr:hypothetical protein [Gemmatimonadota bacterium]